MKLFLGVILVSTFLYSQTFHSLDGIENLQGETILLYRLGSGFYLYNSVYKFNTATFNEQLVMRAYNYVFPGGEQTRAINDYHFFPNSENNFVSTGYEINPDNHNFIARNDTAVVWDLGYFERMDISNQNPLKVFALTDGGIARSFDSGYTYPVDSLIISAGFMALSLADFDDSIFFGVDEEQRFAKNGAVVDTSTVFFDRYFNMLYDRDGQHAYRVNYTYGGWSFNVSYMQGNAFTWTKSYYSDFPLFVTKDDSLNGTLYLADKNVIYKSDNDYGYNFVPYKTLPYKINGLYKKSGTNVLYASTAYRIYKITPDTTVITKSLPVPPDLFDWFPMAVGNRWIFTYISRDGNCFPADSLTEISVITKDTLINGKHYYKFDPPMAHQYTFLRIDSSEAKLKTVYPPSDTNESAIYDFLMEPGDTVYSQYEGFYLANEDSILLFGSICPRRDLQTLGFIPPSYSLVKGIGYYKDDFCEFGGWERILKGCVINSLVYGDTTLSALEDYNSMVPIKFALFQNYPNPFNPATNITYSIPEYSDVIIKVFDILGNEIETLVNEEKPAGQYEVNWNAADMPSGVYFYQLRAGSYIETMKMILMK